MMSGFFGSLCFADNLSPIIGSVLNLKMFLTVRNIYTYARGLDQTYTVSTFIHPWNLHLYHNSKTLWNRYEDNYCRHWPSSDCWKCKKVPDIRPVAAIHRLWLEVMSLTLRIGDSYHLHKSISICNVTTWTSRRNDMRRQNFLPVTLRPTNV